MTRSKSFNKIPKHRALYHALIESILEDEDVMDKGVDDELKKRKPDDVDKDEGPYCWIRPRSAKVQVEEPIFVQDSDYAKHDDDESDTSLDPEWNEGKVVDVGPEQGWLNALAKATKPPLTFDELMHTPIDFYAFAMNRLKINNLTKVHLVGPVYNLLKGTCKIYVELDYTMEECYRALSEQIDWNNPEGHHYFFFNNDLEYLRGGSNEKKYATSTTKSKVARYKLKGIEDMVPNLWSPVKVVYDRYAMLEISH
ncbi:hypothetical protein Tco_1069477 [Tanacetum coccineum]|uniref:Uncharacterized protein n=1 Tax=Tanacetum coccineum TaxID=301880 RepID=A0ABQ5HJ38_9ASTR